MRSFFVVALFAVCAFGADRIPAGAKEVEPYTYAVVDAHGETWMYRQTPFGLKSWRPSDIPTPRFANQPGPVTATERDGEVRFERQTPFGHNVWTKKKSDLTADERMLLSIAGSATETK